MSRARIFGCVGSIGWLAIALGVSAASCGKSDAEGGSPAAATTAAPNEDRPERSEGFTLDAFCAEVFAASTVGKAIGVDGLEARSRRGRTAPGTAHCVLEKGAGGIPEAQATLQLDCRSVSLEVERHRAQLRGLGGRDGGGYRDVSLGRGGGHAKTLLLRKPHYTVIAIHATLPCVLTVTTAQLEADHAEELARVVHDALTDGNYPRP